MTHGQSDKENYLVEALSRLSKKEEAEGAPMWFRKPDRWYDNSHWRCVNDHVSLSYLKTDRGDRCLECHEHVYLTFPEDVDGTELQ